MKRVPMPARANWQTLVQDMGLLWHTPDGQPYWIEDRCYQFSQAEAQAIRAATQTCYQLFLEVGQRIIDRKLYDRLGIPDFMVPLIERSWEEEPAALNYGRFDFGFDGVNPPKLFEFNCDTPTGLLEAAVIQWQWAQGRGRQFNDIHDLLVEKWRDIIPYLPSAPVWFMSAGGDWLGEDLMTATYLRETAQEAGLPTDGILAPDIGWDSARHIFVDLNGREIETIFKLYPWEWLTREDFGRNIPLAPTLWIEPAWKMLWSNKAVLPLLWDMFPGHPNLLEAATVPLGRPCVAKPAFGREGRGVFFVDSDTAPAADAQLGPLVYQARFDIPEFDDKTPVIGSWIVDGTAGGIGVREGGRITDNGAAFVPHLVAG